MVNKWEVGKLYVFEPDHQRKQFLPDDWNWLHADYVTYEDAFVLLVRPRSENVPKDLPAKPVGNFGKILTSTGHTHWVLLERGDCSLVSKRWFKKQSSGCFSNE